MDTTTLELGEAVLPGQGAVRGVTSQGGAAGEDLAKGAQTRAVVAVVVMGAGSRRGAQATRRGVQGGALAIRSTATVTTKQGLLTTAKP